MKTLIKGLVAATNNTARTMVARVYETVTPAETSIEEYRKDPEAYKQNYAVAISEDKTSLIAGICAVAAKVYCEENKLEMVGAGV